MSRKHLALFPGMFGEVEMLAMTDEDINDLKGILDADLADSILDLMRDIDNPDEDTSKLSIYPELVSFNTRLKRYLYDTCYRLTFHKRVKEKEILSFIAKLDMKLAIDIIKETPDIEQVKENLDWLFKNRSYWRTMTEKRSREGFIAFKEMCSRVQSASSGLHNKLKIIYPKDDIDKPINIKYVLKVNKDCFYSPFEKPQRTGMGMLNDYTLSKIDLFLKGLEYFEICKQQGVERDRRVFII